MSSRQQGLTLIELMVTLAVAIILVAVGMPLFTGVAANNRAAAEANALLSAVRLARSEAVKRSETITLCPVSDPTAAVPSCTGNDDDWHLGWSVFRDDGGSTDEHIRVWGAPGDDATIDSDSVTQIQFTSTGSAVAAVNIALTQADTTGTQNRCIAVNTAGQVRMKRGGTCP